MSTIVATFGRLKKPWQWASLGLGFLFVWGIVAFPSRHITTSAISDSSPASPIAGYVGEPRAFAPEAPPMQVSAALKATTAGRVEPDATFGRKIVRTDALQMIVQNPAETADKLTVIAEKMGGYLVSAEGGSNAQTGEVTIRVPAGRFDEVRTEIRQLGLRLESEKISSQDVTLQYTDQEAGLRNLRAEEAQYISILKQANTVKDMVAVTQQLSEVRGEIERQQAELNALSQQVETVALTVSLRRAALEQSFWPNWHLGDQARVALRDGLESVISYAMAMLALVFYLPATLLWSGTVLLAIVAGWKIISWIGRRWFSAPQAAPSQG